VLIQASTVYDIAGVSEFVREADFAVCTMAFCSLN